MSEGVETASEMLRLPVYRLVTESETEIDSASGRRITACRVTASDGVATLSEINLNGFTTTATESVGVETLSETALSAT